MERSLALLCHSSTIDAPDPNRARPGSHGTEAGGAQIPVTFTDEILGRAEQSVDLLALDEALRKLAELDPKLAELVELRFFGGLTIEETAEVMGTSAATVKRGWAFSQAWLRRELIS